MECSAECCECSYPAYRPRGALARALYMKQIADHHLASLDQAQWYRVNETMLDPMVKSLFAPSQIDSETEKFIARSTDISDNILLQIFHSLVKIFLGFFMTQTSINGMLGRGAMFVFSSRQFAAVTGLTLGGGGALLDLGAGDGSVTLTMAGYFEKVHTTEISKQMRGQLNAKGFRVLEEGEIASGRYKAVSCLNVLDRCDKPLSMLREVRRAMSPDGIAILAIVLPFKPYVESGGKDHKPVEVLPIKGTTFEEQANSFIKEVLTPSGFKVERWTRLPYLCEGDLSQSYYWLDDALFVLSSDGTKQ